MNRTILQQPSLVHSQLMTTTQTTVTELPRKDGTSLLAFEQPALNRCALDEPDRVVLDEAAQLSLYKHLHTKFAVQPGSFR
ncbi:hypothetical protein KMB83_gp42 [Ralstonia phage Anchaing]|uniref:Uncharacterized protein n=1 Tax=Ralstonia phage Anchaing TaxID=2759719 RepID=A0A7G5B8D9_9CAUD|nr:hypothetical protein KMB83_gp42 [Ralstonia phage Anchaing]QMV32562.1 hypothetical protein A1_00042 [Ralstonia phage Anchaing]